jgi:pyrimidine deaminase RibD-like protein
MYISDFRIHSTDKLDALLANCAERVLSKQQEDSEYWGWVGACILDPEDRVVYGVNYKTSDGTRCHAERAAIQNYNKKYGDVPSGSIIITTLSPCSTDMDERYGESCTDLVNDSSVRKVYCGYEDPTQTDSDTYLHKQFHTRTTRNKKLHQLCKKLASTFL